MAKLENGIPAELYAELLHNPFIGICITDGKGLVLAVNEAQTRITSIPKEQFIGKYMRDLVSKKVLSISSTVEVLKEQGPIMLHQVLNNGRSYEVQGLPIYGEDGKIKYVVSYLLDVSDLVEVKEIVNKLQADKELIEDKYKTLKEALDKSGSIVYQSQKMQGIVEMAKKVADSWATVLITGPSGCGKELIANLLHEESCRKDGPFIKINCAAIPEQLLESELFGYEPGSFTGGNQKGKKGLFEYANGGSLLLDEIGEMPLALQAKLLRVLQDQEVRRIGGNKTIKVNIRLIASTNASLKKLIAEKKFREDLYYRLNVIELKMPSLCQRRDDIPILVEHFVRVFNTKYGLHKTIQWDAVQYLSSRDYPGNVRELRNIVERLMIQSQGDAITLKDAFETFDVLKVETKTTDISVDMETMKEASLKEIMAAYESKVLGEYMKVYGSAAAVAQKLKTDRTTISRKLSRYKI